MRKATIVGTACLAALMAIPAVPAAAQAFAVVGRSLDQAECARSTGGETYVEVDSGRTRACVSSVPRDKYGLDYSRAGSYTVEVKNKITKKRVDSGADMYDATTFPVCTTEMDVRTIGDDYRKKRYGSSAGEWITTEATTTVTAYPKNAKGEADTSKPFTRQDTGYFWHANNARSWEEQDSAGCLLSRKSDIDRVISTMKADGGKKRIRVN